MIDVTEAVSDVLSGAPNAGRQRQIDLAGVSIGLARYPDDISALVRGSFAPCFVLGQPEYPFTDSIASVAGVTLYASDRWPDLRPESWLADSRNRELLHGLALVSGESLSVASNQIDLRGFPRGIDVWRTRVENLAALVPTLRAPPQADLGADHLVARGVDRSFIEQWALSDDVDRAALITSASDAQLAEMLEAMGRAWPQLAPLVQGTERDAPGADIARILVEAAEEIEIEVGRRRGA